MASNAVAKNLTAFLGGAVLSNPGIGCVVLTAYETPTVLERTASLSWGQQRSEKWIASFRKLESLKELENDWDDEGAEKPRPELIVAARRLLVHLRDADKKAPARVSASSEGTVVLEWQEPGYYEEYEVVEPTLAERMEMIGDRSAVHENISI